MSVPTEITLGHLDNSHAFMREAVTYAISAKNDARKWQFAVVTLVQSLELSLKSLLFKIHPILIYENVDNPKNTVGPVQALDRLSNAKIGKMSFYQNERRRIQTAIDLRNQMTHSEFVLRPEYAAAKFLEMFAFVTHFQARHLMTEIEAIIPVESLAELLAIDKGVKVMAEKARQRIVEEQIDADSVRECPNCGNESFIIENDVNTCYTCRHIDQMCECQGCQAIRFDYEMVDFSGEFEMEFSEGRGRVHDNYGYSFSRACLDCVSKIKEDIARERADAEYQWQMENAYWEEWQHAAAMESNARGGS
jgi:hypothetical protein